MSRSIFDNHHLLWQKNKWNKGYGRLLRNHPYFKRLIPADTLHRQIHSRIADIPMPSGVACKHAYETVCALIEEGELSIEYDTIEKRLDVLIGVWKVEEFPMTILMLKLQRDIVSSFYQR